MKPDSRGYAPRLRGLVRELRNKQLGCGNCKRAARVLGLPKEGLYFRMSKASFGRWGTWSSWYVAGWQEAHVSHT